ncbi:uncharacterized protein LOC132268477 [Cornus florida]|uniref:uncharacterized protein LOC132268477 n=1 Tax=Cornus florida TaxID=4283 RepID=UPI00289E9594|nr:uncharacterized protein LOC132268477 [Cornus florida]
MEFSSCQSEGKKVLLSLSGEREEWIALVDSSSFSLMPHHKDEKLLKIIILHREDLSEIRLQTKSLFAEASCSAAKHEEICRSNLNKRTYSVLRLSSPALPLHDCQTVYIPKDVNKRKEFPPTSKGLLNSEYDHHPNINTNLVSVNGTKSGCTTPDSQHVVPNSGDIDVEIEELPRQGGGLGARELANDVDSAVREDDVYHCRERGHKPSHNPINATVKLRREFLCGVLLLIAALVASVTYQAAFRILGGNLGDKQDSNANRSFVWFNSTGFIASVSLIIFLLHEYPLKPWTQISVCTLFGSYMYLIMATSPHEAFVLLFLGIPFLLFAAAGQLRGFARPRSKLK